MNKFIKSSLLAFTLITAIVLNGCDAFESFQFNVPIQFTFEASGSNLSDNGFSCLEEDETYEDIKDDINSISLIEIYLAVIDINPESIQGDVALKIYGGSSAVGSPLIEYSLNDVNPNNYKVTPLKLELDADDIQAINNYLANDSNQKCFFGTLDITDVQNGGTSNRIEARVDALFNVDATLN